MRTLQDGASPWIWFIVAHIKTDSIKIPDATTEIIEFCKDFVNSMAIYLNTKPLMKKMCPVIMQCILPNIYGLLKKEHWKMEQPEHNLQNRFYLKQCFPKSPLWLVIIIR